MPLTCKKCLTAIAVWVIGATGGCVSGPTQPPQASAESAKTLTFRLAEPKDLKILISTRKAGADGFPTVVADLWNNSADDVVVAYESGSLILHCGPYENHGPDDVFGRRREILDPHQSLTFRIASGGWSRSPTTGPHDLMLPTELPKGKYPMWVTFQVGEDNPSDLIQSDPDTFEVP